MHTPYRVKCVQGLGSKLLRQNTLSIFLRRLVPVIPPRKIEKSAARWLASLQSTPTYQESVPVSAPRASAWHCHEIRREKPYRAFVVMRPIRCPLLRLNIPPFSNLYGFADCSECVVPVHVSDHGCRDFGGANGLALKVVGAVSKTFLVHFANHGQDALVPLRLSLR